jgi:hypothetical protein
MSDEFGRNYLTNIDKSLADENLYYLDINSANVNSDDLVFKFCHEGKSCFGLVRSNGELCVYDGNSYVAFDPTKDTSKFFSFETALEALNNNLNTELQAKNALNEVSDSNIEELTEIMYLENRKSILDNKLKVFFAKKDSLMSNEEFKREHETNLLNSKVFLDEAFKFSNDKIDLQLGLKDTTDLIFDRQSFELARNNFSKLRYNIDSVDLGVSFAFRHEGKIFYGSVQSNGDSADFFVSNNPNDKGQSLDPKTNLALFNSFQCGFRELSTYANKHFEIDEEVKMYKGLINAQNSDIKKNKSNIANYESQKVQFEKLVTNAKDESVKANLRGKIAGFDTKIKECKLNISDKEKQRVVAQAQFNFLLKCKNRDNRVFGTIEDKFQNRITKLLSTPEKYQPYSLNPQQQSKPSQQQQPSKPVTPNQYQQQPSKPVTPNQYQQKPSQQQPSQQFNRVGVKKTLKEYANDCLREYNKVIKKIDSLSLRIKNIKPNNKRAFDRFNMLRKEMGGLIKSSNNLNSCLKKITDFVRQGNGNLSLTKEELFSVLKGEIQLSQIQKQTNQQSGKFTPNQNQPSRSSQQFQPKPLQPSQSSQGTSFNEFKRSFLKLSLEGMEVKLKKISDLNERCNLLYQKRSKDLDRLSKESKLKMTKKERAIKVQELFNAHKELKKAHAMLFDINNKRRWADAEVLKAKNKRLGDAGRGLYK